MKKMYVCNLFGAQMLCGLGCYKLCDQSPQSLCTVLINDTDFRFYMNIPLHNSDRPGYRGQLGGREGILRSFS